jgi:hypothetical protein
VDGRELGRGVMAVPSKIYSEEKQKLSDCVNASGIVIELD